MANVRRRAISCSIELIGLRWKNGSRIVPDQPVRGRLPRKEVRKITASSRPCTA